MAMASKNYWRALYVIFPRLHFGRLVRAPACFFRDTTCCARKFSPQQQGMQDIIEVLAGRIALPTLVAVQNPTLIGKIFDPYIVVSAKILPSRVILLVKIFGTYGVFLKILPILVVHLVYFYILVKILILTQRYARHVKLTRPFSPEPAKNTCYHVGRNPIVTTLFIII